MQCVAIDTTSAVATLALFSDGVCVATRTSEAFQGQAEALLPLIEKTLTELSWDKRAVGVWCACAGPGSFTGIRIALATVRGICLATGAAGVSVSSFAAVRASAEDPDACLAIVLPGLPGEHFCEIATGSHVHVPPVLLTDATLAETLAAHPHAKLVSLARVDATAVGKAYLRFGGDASLAPLYIAPPRITMPKPKTYAAVK